MSFSQDWFSQHIPIWTRLLQEFKGKAGLRVLEIGTFEGRSTCWLLENIVTGEGAHIDCIDTFQGAEDMVALNLDMSNMRDVFESNIAPWRDRVSVYALRRYCADPARRDARHQMGADEVYSVGSKMFAVFWIDGKKAKTMSFKCDPERFLELTDQSGIVPAPYLARAHWVQVQDAKALADVQARALLARSHALVFAKLTRKEQAAIKATVPSHRKA